MSRVVLLIATRLGGTLPFLKGSTLRQRNFPALIGLTPAGSILGACLLLVVPSKAMPVVIATAMIIVVVFSFVQPNAGLVQSSGQRSRSLDAAGYVATFILGIYGGFFSGGYVALLTAACVAFFGMTFLEAVAVTKVLNVFSSLIATIIFAKEGIVDWNLGLLLGAVSFGGAAIGATLAQRMSNVWLRRVFLTSVIVLAIKTLLMDVFSTTIGTSLGSLVG